MSFFALLWFTGSGCRCGEGHGLRSREGGSLIEMARSWRRTDNMRVTGVAKKSVFGQGPFVVECFGVDDCLVKQVKVGEGFLEEVVER